MLKELKADLTRLERAAAGHRREIKALSKAVKRETRLLRRLSTSVARIARSSKNPVFRLLNSAMARSTGRALARFLPLIGLTPNLDDRTWQDIVDLGRRGGPVEHPQGVGRRPVSRSRRRVRRPPVDRMWSTRTTAGGVREPRGTLRVPAAEGSRRVADSHAALGGGARAAIAGEPAGAGPCRGLG
jgi:hypothetical protein